MEMSWRKPMLSCVQLKLQSTLITMSIFWIILLVSISGTKHAEEECESDLVERMPALEGPFSALQTLKLTNTSFVNCINDPPGPAKLGMENVKKKPERKLDSTGSGSSKMVVRHVRFLDSLKTSDKENFLPAVMKRSREKLWTFSHVDFQPSFKEPAVSSACKGMCQGVGSMEAYDRAAKVVAPKHQELRKEEGLHTLLMQKLNTDRVELKKVIDRLRDLNNELESLHNWKKELENRIEECSYKLERAEKMSLGGKEDRGMEAASYNLSIIKVSDSTYVRTLENAIQFGTLVFLENIGEEELGALSEPVLLMATFKQQGGEYRRLRENVLEYSSNFKFLLNGFLVEYYLEESDHVTKEPMSLVMLKQVAVSDAKEHLVGADEKEANEAATIAQGIQEECEGDLAEAMPALDPPVSAPLALNLSNTSFFKPMPDPPIPVNLAMESVKEGVRAVEEHDRAVNVVAPKHEQLREADGLPPGRMNETTHSGEE